MPPHVIDVSMRKGRVVWDVTCPYPDDEWQKPCAMIEGSFFPGCGVIGWMADIGGDDWLAMAADDTINGEFPLKVAVTTFDSYGGELGLTAWSGE